MKCHVCGTPMRRVVADLPFRVNLSVIIILRGLPLVECSKCSAYALEEEVMERVHEIVGRLRSPSHLEAVLYTLQVLSFTLSELRRCVENPRRPRSADLGQAQESQNPRFHL